MLLSEGFFLLVELELMTCLIGKKFFQSVFKRFCLLEGRFLLHLHDDPQVFPSPYLFGVIFA